jgi:hypothetical protein
MGDRPVYLAVCAACGAYPAGGVYACEVPQPRPFYCPSCRSGLVSPEEHAQPNAIVRKANRPDGPFSQLVVLSRDGDRVTVRPLGFPDGPEETLPLAELAPEFSYARRGGFR